MKRVDITTLVTTLFQRKKEWQKLEHEDKEANFFMFNRCAASQFPLQAEKFNYKGVDRSTAMDIWSMFFRKLVAVPAWFWNSFRSAAKGRAKPDAYAPIKDRLNLSDQDIEVLKHECQEELDDELELIASYNAEEEQCKKVKHTKGQSPGSKTQQAKTTSRSRSKKTA